MGRLLYVIGGAILAFALLSCTGMSMRLGTKLVEKSDRFELLGWHLKFDNQTEYIYCVVQIYLLDEDAETWIVEWYSPTGELYQSDEFKLGPFGKCPARAKAKCEWWWCRYSFWSRLAVRGTKAATMLGTWRAVLRRGSYTRECTAVVFTLTQSPEESTNALPTADFVWQPLSLTGGRLLVSPKAESRVRFDASGSSDPDGRIVEYAWDWDADGDYDELYTEPICDHTFPGPGSYRVALRVTDDQGAIAVAIKTVTIEMTPSSEMEEPMGEVWALLVGINRYARVESLRFAEADATAFHRLLRDRCGVPEAHIRLLIGKGATLAALRAGLEWLSQVAEAGDTVLFYFSGHGAAVQDENGDEEDDLDECLVPFDAALNRLSETTLLDDELVGWANGLGTKHIVLILDVAHGGGFELSHGVSIAPGGETELAWEKEELGHGVLTYFLLRGLGIEGEPEADLDADGIVTVGELRDYLEQKVPAFLEETEGQAQEPQVTILGVPENQPFLCFKGEIPQAPHAEFSFSPQAPTTLETVRFTELSTDPDGEIVAWHWDFGDGSTSSERNPTHRYSQKGTFVVELRVTDSDGLNATVTHEITVENIPPHAQFTFSPESPRVGEPISFDASPSEDPDGEIVQYAWDFDGDGVADAEGARVSWTFTGEGSCTVSLTVVDNDGATGTITLKVQVFSPTESLEVHDQWAVVVGVGDYQDPGIRDLRFSEADAQAFYEFLVDPEGGGFPEDHVRLFLGSEATQQAIRAAFGWLIEGAEEDDLVVFYFSGHGSYDTDFNGDEGDGFDEYLVPYDAKPDNLYGTAVRDDEIGDWLSSLRSRYALLVLDTCFSGGAMRTVRGFDNPTMRVGPGNRVFTDLVGEGRLFLASSQEGEPSYENEGLGHGVFTYFLLKGLGWEGKPEADTDGDGRVTVEELKAYLEEQVPTYVREKLHERPQHPLLEGDLNITKLAITGYGRKLIGEVTAFQGDYVVISLGSRQGVKPGDRFQVVHPIELPDGTVISEVRAVIEVVYFAGPDRAVCRIVELSFPIKVHDRVRPLEG